MKKTVYKITNNINNKVYIGQTSQDIRTRFKQHKYGSYTSLIQRAIKKYGEENFLIESLYHGVDYNEMEIFFIKEYESQNPLSGYNIQPGGEEPPVWTGDDSPFALFDQSWFEKTISLLQDSDFEQREIAKIQGCHISTVSRINLGYIRKDSDIQYPIRKNRLTKETVRELQWFLINTDFHREELTEMYGCSISSIKAIRSGQNHRKDCFSYPLGGTDIRLGLKQYDKIEKLKKDLERGVSVKSICLKYKVSFLRLQYINEGKIYFEEDISYPINDRIEKAVETIPVIGE